MKAKTKQNKKEYYSMKKLVVMAAALVAAASSYAQCAPGPDPVDVDCAQVYNVSMSLKTTAAKSGAIDIGDECSPGSTSVCYRVISSKSYKGYYWNCSCECDAFDSNVLELFDKKSDEMVVESESISWTILGRIGKKNTDIEAYGNINGDIYLMGFGKWDSKKGRVSSISGNVQAVLGAPLCIVACAPGGIALPYDLCIPDTQILVDTIAYGSFSIKYNSSASKKLAADADYIDSLLPEGSAD
jgi:hypothetical protein